MASGSRARRREPSPPSFFVDRGLGRRHVAAVFRDAGFVVVLMSELYPGGADQFVSDDVWIGEVGRRRLVALTKDASIARDHGDAMRHAELRAFALPNAALTGEVMAVRFAENLHRIVQRSRKPGPFLDIVYPDRVERRWP